MASTFQTLADVYADVRYNTGKDSTTLTDAQLLRLANKYYAQIVRHLVDLNEDIYAEISSADLVANQMEYVLPVDNTSSTYGGGAIKIMRVEVSLDGTNWYEAKPFGLSNLGIPFMKAESGNAAAITTINLEFSSTQPYYSFADRSIFLLPIPVSTDSVAASNANLMIYWVKRPNELTSSSSIPDIPKDFLNVLSEGIMQDVFRKSGRTADFRLAKQEYKDGISEMRAIEANEEPKRPFVFKASPKNYK